LHLELRWDLVHRFQVVVLIWFKIEPVRFAPVCHCPRTANW